MERELLLLGLLRRTDLHGYMLHELIEQNLASCTDLKKPTAYYLLDKMQEKGWIAITEEAQSGSRPPRRLYHVTPAGEVVYQQALRENLAAYLGARFEGNIGLAFLDDLPKEEAVTLLEQRRTRMQAVLDQHLAAPMHAGSMHLIIDHQIHHLRAELSWLDSLIQRLQSQPSPLENP